MKTLTALSVGLFLAGCASAPRPQMMVLPHKAPIVKAALAPSVAPPVAAPTFGERFKKFRGKLKWIH